jgi:branched-chain amino acid transport system substrate-binding protein
MTRRGIAAMGLAMAIVFAITAAQSGATAKKACDNSNPITVGVLYSMTGPAAGIGKLAQQGASMGFRDVNANGGFLGRCIKEDLQDDQGSPTTAAQVIRATLDQNHAQFVLGPFLSSPTEAIMPVTEQAKVIDVNESADLGSDNPNTWPHVFPAEAHSDLQSAIFIPFLKSHHWTNVAILAPNNAFGTVFVPTFTNLAKAAGINVVASQYVVSGTPDVTPQMTQLRDAKPQAILFIVNADPDQIAGLHAWLSLGMSNIPVLGTSALQNTATTNNFTADQMKNVYAYAYKSMTYTATNPRSSSPLANAFSRELATWIHAHGFKESISQSAGSYDAITLLAKAVNGANSLDSDKVKAYFESHWMNGVRGQYIWTSYQHRGVTLGDFTFVLAKSINRNGFLQRAPAAPAS